MVQVVPEAGGREDPPTPCMTNKTSTSMFVLQTTPYFGHKAEGSDCTQIRLLENKPVTFSGSYEIPSTLEKKSIVLHDNTLPANRTKAHDHRLRCTATPTSIACKGRESDDKKRTLKIREQEQYDTDRISRTSKNRYCTIHPSSSFFTIYFYNTPATRMESLLGVVETGIRVRAILFNTCQHESVNRLARLVTTLNSSDRMVHPEGRRWN